MIIAFYIAPQCQEAVADRIVVGQILDCIGLTHSVSSQRDLWHKHGDDARRSEVFQMSQKGKRLAVGEAASGALINQVEYLSDELVSRVTPRSLISLPASIADGLVIVVGFRGTTEAIDKIATALNADQDRRLFVALLGKASERTRPGSCGENLKSSTKPPSGSAMGRRFE
jgi:hypothetical protein